MSTVRLETCKAADAFVADIWKHRDEKNPTVWGLKTHYCVREGIFQTSSTTAYTKPL